MTNVIESSRSETKRYPQIKATLARCGVEEESSFLYITDTHEAAVNAEAKLGGADRHFLDLDRFLVSVLIHSSGEVIEIPSCDTPLSPETSFELRTNSLLSASFYDDLASLCEPFDFIVFDDVMGNSLRMGDAFCHICRSIPEGFIVLGPTGALQCGDSKRDQGMVRAHKAAPRARRTARRRTKKSRRGNRRK